MWTASWTICAQQIGLSFCPIGRPWSVKKHGKTVKHREKNVIFFLRSLRHNLKLKASAPLPSLGTDLKGCGCRADAELIHWKLQISVSVLPFFLGIFHGFPMVPNCTFPTRKWGTFRIRFCSNLSKSVDLDGATEKTDRGIFFTHLQLGIGLMDPYGKKHFNKSCSCSPKSDLW